MPDQHTRRAVTLGFDFDTRQKNGKLEIIYLPPVAETVHEIVARVKKIGAKPATLRKWLILDCD